MTIALFGGSFNPVHNAHLCIADYVAQHEAVDEVWVMLSPQNPFKLSRNFLPDHVRLHFLEESFKGHDRIKVSGFEISLPKPTYTYRTLTELTKLYPEYSFHLIFGIDILENLLNWKNAVKILERHKVLAYLRPGYEQNLDATLHTVEKGYMGKRSAGSPDFFDQVRIINGPLMDISSSEIWDRLKKKQPISHLVPEVVEKYFQVR